MTNEAVEVLNSAGVAQEKGYVRKVIVHPRETQQGPMFTLLEDGSWIPRLEEYAVIPKELYEKLKDLQGAKELFATKYQ